jgi:uncharacterized protein YndB with AHSA1/START domain
MTSSESDRAGLICALKSKDGKGLLRIEDRFETTIEDVWSAITDPRRLERWFGKIDGDLRVGGVFNMSVEWDGSGRIDACEAPRHLRVVVRESDESYRSGQGVPPFDATYDVTLGSDGSITNLVAEISGMPLDKIAFYGVGWQIHVENLATFLAGKEQNDVEARWGELLPRYEELAARGDL